MNVFLALVLCARVSASLLLTSVHPIAGEVTQTAFTSGETTALVVSDSQSLNEELPSQGDALIEGRPEDAGPYDIDADFAESLRTDPRVQDLGTSWTGYGKGPHQLTNEDLAALTTLSIRDRQLSSIKGLAFAVNVETLDCQNNRLTELDVRSLPHLTTLQCNQNALTTLDVSNNQALKTLDCTKNVLTKLDVRKNTVLETLVCSNNQIYDLSSTASLPKLTTLTASNQQLHISPSGIESGEKTIDLLKTAGQAGLSASNAEPSSHIGLRCFGDMIHLSNVTKETLENQAIHFSYDGTLLLEGAPNGSKFFDGTISFFEPSDLTSTLKASSYKAQSGEDIQWTWVVSNDRTKRAKAILATVTLPTGWVLDPNSIEKNGLSASSDEINGTTSLGSLDPGEEVRVTFTTTIHGTVNEWLEVIGRLEWADDTPVSPHSRQQKKAIKILGKEQPSSLDESTNWSRWRNGWLVWRALFRIFPLLREILL